MEQPQVILYTVLKSQVAGVTGSRVFKPRKIFCQIFKHSIVIWHLLCLFFFSGLNLKPKGQKSFCHILISILRNTNKKMRMSMTIVVRMTWWNDTFSKNCHGFTWIFFFLDVSFYRLPYLSPWKWLKRNNYW